MRLKTLVKRIVIYFLLVFAAFIMQTCVFPVLSFFYAAPNLILIITFSYGFIYGPMPGIITGVFSGFLMDLFYTEPFGMFILIYSWLGFFSGLFSGQLKNDSLIFPLILCVINECCYNGAILCYRYLTLGEMHLRYSVTHVVLPEIFFTILVTLVAYRIMLNANRKLDSIDNIRGQNVA